MRILFVTPHPPSRIRVRSYGFLTQLQREHDVTLVTQCLTERERTHVEALRSQGYNVVAVPGSRRISLVQCGLALFSSTPLQLAYARSAHVAQVVHDLCTHQHFDIVHVEHIRGLASLTKMERSSPPLVWDAVDCISLLWEHAMTAGVSLRVRTIALVEHKRTQRFEAKMQGQVQHVLITSVRDRQAMMGLYHQYAMNAGNGDTRAEAVSNISVIPNGVDLEYFHPVQQEPRHFNLVFLGRMSYHANIATALYLYRQVMPLIWKQRPEAIFTIVGSSPPKIIRRLANDPRVEVTGYVDDIRPFVRSAQVMLCPMAYSVGIQNKVLESMALGTPVVVSARVANALNAQPGRDLLIAESAQEFADAALLLMNDAELHAVLSRSGREYVEQYHDWSALTNQLVSVYQQALVTCKRDSSAFAIAMQTAGRTSQQTI